MLVTVPHSGSRTLRKHLADKGGVKEHLVYLYHLKSFPEGFKFISKYKRILLDDVPEDTKFQTTVRDPLAHAISWIAFSNKGHTASLSVCDYNFFDMWQLWWDYFQDKDVQYYRIEDLPVSRGVGPIRDHPLREALEKRDIDFLKKEIPDFFEWLEDPERRKFYEQYYDLWYLREERNENSDIS